MHSLDNKYLLMIEPDRQGAPSPEPIMDGLTEMVKELYSITYEPNRYYKGWHTTQCHKQSDSCDHVLPNGVIMNSLAVYYIQYYRRYIPELEINKILTHYQLNFPKTYQDRINRYQPVSLEYDESCYTKTPPKSAIETVREAAHKKAAEEVDAFLNLRIPIRPVRQIFPDLDEIN